jgi:hypothetical protein
MNLYPGIKVRIMKNYLFNCDNNKAAYLLVPTSYYSQFIFINFSTSFNPQKHHHTNIMIFHIRTKAHQSSIMLRNRLISPSRTNEFHWKIIPKKPKHMANEEAISNDVAKFH